MRTADSLLLLVLGGASLIGLGCGVNPTENRQPDKRTEARLAELAEIAAFAQAQGADHKWSDEFQDRLGVYTADLQKAMIRTDGTPIALAVELEDVLALEEGGYEVRAYADSLVAEVPQLYLQLRCTDAQASLLLSAHPYSRFAFAVKVDRLWRPFFQANAQGDTEERSVVVEHSDLVVAVGSLVAAVNLKTRDQILPPTVK